MGAKTFKDLIVWQKAHDLVLKIYKATKNFPDDEKFGLVSQMRRSALSIPLNIVEGFRRKGRDKLNFYYYSLGSLEELQYQIFLSLDLNYISEENYNNMNNNCNEVSKILHKWINLSK